MFDAGVMSEGVGRAETVSRREAMKNQGFGASPDGLGAYVEPSPEDGNYPWANPTESSPNPPPVSQSYHARAAHQPMPMHGEIDFLEPDNTSGGAATRSAGFTLLFVALSTGIGYAWKGGLGAATGLLLSGGLANLYRAQKWFESGDPSEKHEAVVSSVFAVGELGASAYVGYKAFQLGESPTKKR